MLVCKKEVDCNFCNIIVIQKYKGGIQAKTSLCQGYAHAIAIANAQARHIHAYVERDLTDENVTVLKVETLRLHETVLNTECRYSWRSLGCVFTSVYISLDKARTNLPGLNAVS